jgi:predicted TIM-barrel fold metal-dependent hydrolase
MPVKMDAHVHMTRDQGFLDALAAQCRAMGIDRVCLNGLARIYPEYAGNAEVIEAARRLPGLVIPFAHLMLGREGAEDVRRYHAEGFRGLKFIVPPANYDDRSFYPAYQAAQDLGLVCLFHTGIVLRTERDRELDVNNDRMRPIRLDTIARAFPRLPIIGAHLGNPWLEEAAMAARWNPNLYFDLTGSVLKQRDAEYLRGLLWWGETSAYRDPLGRHAFAKIVFGTDTSVAGMPEVAADYQRLLDALAVPAPVRAGVWGDTVAGLLGVS